MASTLNTLDCVTDLGNTGLGTCPLIPGTIRGAFFSLSKFELGPADMADLKGALEDMANANNPRQRIYPIHSFAGITDNSEEQVQETLGYGANVPIRDGNYVWLFRYLKGGVCLHNQLRKFNSLNLHVIFYDDNNRLYGQRTENGLSSFPVTNFYVPKWSVSDGSVQTGFNIQFTFDSKYLNDLVGYVTADFDLEEVNGLQTAQLKVVGSPTTTVIPVEAKVDCSGDNVFDIYDAALASGALWSVTDSAGASLTIDSVVANPTLKSWTITLDEARSGAVTVSTVGVTALAVVDVIGFEFKPVTVPS